MLGLLLAAYLALVWRFWFLTDDAYISFRYAKHLAAGEGLRFNLGEQPPVEGYSNFLWVLLCSVFERLGWSIEVAPLVVSVLAGGLLVAFVHRALRGSLELEPLPAGLAAGLVALSPAVAVWSTGGLATMHFALLVFLTFERLLIRPAGPHGVGAGLLGLALALLRVEGILWVAAFLVLAFLTRRGERRLAGRRPVRELWIATALVAVGFGAYSLWRASYYGAAAANTVAAKGGLVPSHVLRGTRYLVANALTFVTPLLLPLTLVSSLRRGRARLGLAVWAAVLGVSAFAVLVGGDYMAMGRFLVPLWPFGALLAGWALTDLHRRSPRLALASGLLVLGVGLPCAWDVHVVPDSLRARFHFRHNTDEYRSEHAKWVAQSRNAREWAACGRGMRFWIDPGSRVATGGIGARGYFSELYLLDTGGLVTPEVSALPTRTDRLRSPGHDKSQPVEFFLEDLPEVMNPWVVPLAELEATLAEECARLERAASGRPRGSERAVDSEAALAARRYVVDFRPLPDGEAGGPEPQLVFWRRTADPAAQRSAREEVERRLAACLLGEDPLRAKLDARYPVAGR